MNHFTDNFLGDEAFWRCSQLRLKSKYSLELSGILLRSMLSKEYRIPSFSHKTCDFRMNLLFLCRLLIVKLMTPFFFFCLSILDVQHVPRLSCKYLIFPLNLCSQTPASAYSSPWVSKCKKDLRSLIWLKVMSVICVRECFSRYISKMIFFSSGNI